MPAAQGRRAVVFAVNQRPGCRARGSYQVKLPLRHGVSRTCARADGTTVGIIFHGTL
ncbi:2OG-Fe(II) oxygenase [Cupriavidus basilensis]